MTRRAVLALVLDLTLALGAPMVAGAGSYTVTTTPEQDAALADSLVVPARVLARHPDAKAVTPQEHIQAIVSGQLDGMLQNKIDREVRQEVEQRVRGKKK